MHEHLPLIRERQIHGTSPADAQTLTPVDCTDPAALPGLLLKAQEAAAAFANERLAYRKEKLARFASALLARREVLRERLLEETGKPEAEIWLHEIGPIADLAAYWAKDGAVALEIERVAFDPVAYPGKRAEIERVPRGVVGLITPWNFPVAIPLRALFPALLAGNAVIWKPSEYTARVAEPIAAAANEAFGPNAVTLLQGGGELGAALVTSGVDSVVFTGSVRTGRKVAAAAAEALIPVALELGGKDPAVVLDDADLERTARGLVWGALVNSGQNCASIERVYVTKKNARPLADRIVELVRTLEPGKDFGPLVTPAQLEIVQAHVEAARSAGAEVLFGGHVLERPGQWYAPTVLLDPPRDNVSVVEETFGPLLPLITVESEEEALREANTSRFGLTASVWTRDLERGERLAKRIKAGVVMVNNHGFTGAVPALPWSGVGESGYGVTNSPYTLEAFTRPRALVVDTRTADREMWWHPYGEALVNVGRSLTALRSGGGLGEKAGAVKSLASGFVNRWKG